MEALVRDDDVQVLHGFNKAEQANAYLTTGLFTSDVVGALEPLLDLAPDVRIYKAGLMLRISSRRRWRLDISRIARRARWDPTQRDRK
jgi:hypothetical protein